MPEQLLSDREVEKQTKRARSTLQKDRVAGRGIPFVRLGRLVRYRQRDVDAYIASLPSRRSTSEVEVWPMAAEIGERDPPHEKRGPAGGRALESPHDNSSGPRDSGTRRLRQARVRQ